MGRRERLRPIFLLLILTASLAGGCEREQDTAVQTSPAVEETVPQPQNGSSEPNGPIGAESFDPELGERVYRQACAGCHEEGVSGAPKTGDAEQWAPRIATGLESLIGNALKGFQGNQGVMPPRGGRPELTDREVASAVAYMVERSRQD